MWIKKKKRIVTGTNSLCLIAPMESASTSLHGHVTSYAKLTRIFPHWTGIRRFGWILHLPSLFSWPFWKRGNDTFFTFFILWKGFIYSKIRIIRSNDVMISTKVSWFLLTLDHAISTGLRFKLVSVCLTLKINLQALMIHGFYRHQSLITPSLPRSH